MKMFSASMKNYGKLVSKTHRRLVHNVIGIDLGTTNSAVAVLEGSEVKILENEEGGRTTPSVVAFNGDNKPLVGLPAKRQAIINPQNTFFATKRLIGRKYTDTEVQNDLNNVPFKIIPNENGDAWVSTTDNRKFSPSHISGNILSKMKEIADSYFHDPVKHAVVTVPAYFNDSQRQATKAAGKIAGLDVLRVINEPTAAALAYGIDKKQKDGIVAVFDLGGGTFDISILDIEDGVFEVRATNGNTHLGGEDFDILLLNYILDGFKAQYGIDISTDRLAVQRIREAAENCKIELSHVKQSEISIPFIKEDKHINFTLTEDELDNMSLHLINKTIDPVKKCIRDAGLKVKDIDEVILVGGMTRMPKIRKVVEDLFKKTPNTQVNPDEAVAMGAAIQGAVLSGQIKDVVLLDVTPLSLGIETYGGIFSPLIPRNTAIPVKKEQEFSTAVDGQTGVEIRVFQGERSLVKDNKLIGHFLLKDIPVSPKGVPQIGVEFEIDADGIIHVAATDKTKYPEDSPHYGKENKVSITVAGEIGLSEEEIERLIKESKENAKRDQELKQHIENATRADIVCADTDNVISQFGKLMEEQEIQIIQEKLKSLRNKINDIRDRGIIHDPQVIRDEVDEMQKICMGAIQKVAVKQQQLKGK